MKLRDGAYVVGAEVVESDDQQVLVITERGFGKRTELSQYTRKGRGGLGVLTINITEKTGMVAAVRLVAPDHELMLVSESGILIRTKVDTIRLLSRITQGVTVMKVDDDDTVASIANYDPGDSRRRSAERAQAELPMNGASNGTGPVEE